MRIPTGGGIARGLVTPQLPDKEALVISLGILGATVMPHNLYLHSSIVQTRAYEKTSAGLRHALRFATTDTVVALGMAFFVNAAILIVAAAAFHARGQFEVAGLEKAHELLKPMLGGAAATAFAVALLASGQSSTITGTLAGQIVMEGFLKLHIAPWLRRLITRMLAIVPAMVLIAASGGKDTVRLLIFSQVVLSMQLSFAIFPLLAFTSDKKRMGEHVNPLWLKLAGLVVCTLIAGLNIKLLWDTPQIGPRGLGPELSELRLSPRGFTGAIKRKTSLQSRPSYDKLPLARCLFGGDAHAALAQLVEHRTENPSVTGSSPVGGMKEPLQIWRGSCHF